LQAYNGGPIEELEFIPFPNEGTGFPTWGRAKIDMTNLQYEVTFHDLPSNRKIRPKHYFSGYSPTISNAGFHIHLRRKSTPYLLNYYLPSGLLVIVSWVSYAIPPAEAIPGRITLVITSFLALANIGTSAFASSPTNQGINSLQVLLFTLYVHKMQCYPPTFAVMDYFLH